jgi:intersectin
MQTKTPNQVLAQIWALSDVNKDGKLNCEEFVLALYFCELYVTGQQLPATLPPELIPPSLRTKPVSRSGSISSQGAGSNAGEMETVGGGSIHSSFEDRRKENYDKGQAELERRRRLLEEQAKREVEERERKEREEAEKREKARLEAEQRKQEEIQREIQRQKELEEAREEERKRELERKEQARKEMEKQRQQEWENQKLQEMEAERQKEQEKLLKLKGQNQNLTIELESLSVKVKELSQKICDTRVTVTTVKSNIDEMRSVRDTCMSEQSQIKQKIKEQNAKLVQLSQEKSKIDSKMKTQEDANLVTNKQIAIKQLKDKTEDIKSTLEEKKEDFETHVSQKKEMKQELEQLIISCEGLYNEYDVVRIQVLELKNNQKNDLHSSWGATTNDTWAPSATTTTSEPALPDPIPGYIRYRAVYDFSARNKDEITFYPGDIIMVPIQQTGEEGWLAGELNGNTGWFPETYVEKIDNDEIVRVAAETAVVAETSEAGVNDGIADYGRFVAIYPYASAESGDLNFEAGEEMQVIKQDGDWWTGVIGDRTGIFPANYVQPVDDNQPSAVGKSYINHCLSVSIF